MKNFKNGDNQRKDYPEKSYQQSFISNEVEIIKPRKQKTT